MWPGPVLGHTPAAPGTGVTRRVGAGGGGEEERTVGRKLQIVLGLLSPVLIAVLGVAPSVDSE